MRNKIKIKNSRYIKPTAAGTFQVRIVLTTTAETPEEAEAILNIMQTYKKRAIAEAANLKAGVHGGDGTSLREKWGTKKSVRLAKKRKTKLLWPVPEGRSVEQNKTHFHKDSLVVCHRKRGEDRLVFNLNVPNELMASEVAILAYIGMYLEPSTRRCYVTTKKIAATLRRPLLDTEKDISGLVAKGYLIRRKQGGTVVGFTISRNKMHVLNNTTRSVHY